MGNEYHITHDSLLVSSTSIETHVMKLMVQSTRLNQQ
jgi:hypothetical protein